MLARKYLYYLYLIYSIFPVAANNLLGAKCQLCANAVQVPFLWQSSWKTDMQYNRNKIVSMTRNTLQPRSICQFNIDLDFDLDKFYPPGVIMNNIYWRGLPWPWPILSSRGHMNNRCWNTVKMSFWLFTLGDLGWPWPFCAPGGHMNNIFWNRVKNVISTYDSGWPWVTLTSEFDLSWCGSSRQS